MPNTRSLMVAAFLLVVGGGASYAQQADTEQLQTALKTLHAAISALDVANIEPLWAHTNYVMAKTPPDKSISVGWDAVKKDWEANFSRVAELHVSEAAEGGPHIHVNGDVAWALGIYPEVGKLKTGAAINARVVETVVFEKQNGKWLLVSLTATRLHE
jgi:ketosteroid isomerase-like protein